MNRSIYRFISLYLPALILFSGCISPSSRIARYIQKHPERPQAISSALENRTVVSGMTAAEARLCLGPPNSIERSESNSDEKGDTWHYVEASKASDTLKGSSLWVLDIPKATIYFSPEGIVTEVVYYNDLTSKEPSSAVTKEPVNARPAIRTPATSTRSRKQKKRARPILKPYVPKPDELGSSGWPKIELSGVSVMGSNSRAILNDNLYEEGESLEGVKLLNIYANGALLEYRGARTFLQTGDATK